MVHPIKKSYFVAFMIISQLLVIATILTYLIITHTHQSLSDQIGGVIVAFLYLEFPILIATSRHLMFKNQDNTFETALFVAVMYLCMLYLVSYLTMSEILANIQSQSVTVKFATLFMFIVYLLPFYQIYLEIRFSLGHYATQENQTTTITKTSTTVTPTVHDDFNPTIPNIKLSNPQLALPITSGYNALIQTRVTAIKHQPNRTLAVLGNQKFGETNISITSAVKSNKWQKAHDASLTFVIQLILKAIQDKQENINIVYDYDGVFAYAAGYWPTANYQNARDYVLKLDELSHQINIRFTKYTKQSAPYYKDLLAECK